MQNRSELKERVAHEVHSLISDGYRVMFSTEVNQIWVVKLRHAHTSRVLHIITNYVKQTAVLKHNGKELKRID